MRALHAAFIALALASLSACSGTVGNGTVTTEKRELSGFTSIDLSGSGKLTVHRGDFKVLVTTDSNLQSSILTEVSGKELRIGTRPGAVVLPTRLEYEVSLPGIEGMELSGSGSAALDPFEGSDFRAGLSGSGSLSADLAYSRTRVTVSGSGEVVMKGSLGALDVDISGSGQIRASGKASGLGIGVSGSGQFDGRDLEASSARVRVSGSGDIDLRAADELAADLSGSGSLTYWGNPRLSAHTSGSGRITRAGD